MAKEPLLGMDFYLTPHSGFEATTRGFQNEQNHDLAYNRQAGLNAVLADWPSASDIAERSAHLLSEAQGLLDRLSQPTIDEQDMFWSSIAGAIVVDRITI